MNNIALINKVVNAFSPLNKENATNDYDIDKLCFSQEQHKIINELCKLSKSELIEIISIKEYGRRKRTDVIHNYSFEAISAEIMRLFQNKDTKELALYIVSNRIALRDDFQTAIRNLRLT